MVPIWSLTLLLAMVPWDDGLQQGEDAPHLGRARAAQDSLSQTARAAAFRARWGTHHVRWDARNGTPRALMGPGLMTAVIPALVADVARLGGVDPRSLSLTRVTDGDDRETWVYEQHHRGAPIEGGGVVVHVRGGRVSLILASLHLPKLATDPLPGEVLLADHDASPLEYTWARRQDHATGVRFLDRGDQVVHAWSTVFPLELETEERTVGDPLVVVPAREVMVTTADGTSLTDDDGLHSLSDPVDVRLEGPNLLLRNHETPIEVAQVVDGLLLWDLDLVPAASSVQHHFHTVWDWLQDRRPSHTWLDRQVTASVLVPGSCNAYYTNGTINFYPADDRCADFGRIADVIFHEVGHGIHHYIIEEGTFAGDVSEGSSDFVSATILDDPVLAPEATGPGTWIREIETDKVYPDDATGSSHNDGLIWASFLWNLRTSWRDTYGVETGTRMVDELFLETLSYGPTLTDLTEAVLAADDDDADLRNSTPHACELIEGLNDHGLGPGSLGLVLLEHEPLEAQDSWTDGYGIDFTVEQVTGECGDVDLDSVRVLYGVDLPLSGAPFDPGVLLELVPSRTDDAYSAVIPRQFPGARVSYAMTWISTDGETTAVTHDDRRDGLHDFFVGDREALWCADFEHGWDGVSTTNRVYGTPSDSDWLDEWEQGAPQGQDWNPTGAWTGSAVIGTSLDEEGLYSAYNGQRAQTADLRLDDANPRMLLLSSRRWLTVEDGKYDRAQVWADRESDRQLMWANPDTSDGTRPLLDVDWTLFDVDLRTLLDTGEDVRLAFTLETDGGLEYGGWALDELCLVTLADEPGHYRVRDLEASDDQDTVSLTWTQPMIEPLSATVLVRKRDATPVDADDGLIVDIDLAPVPGQAREATDSEVAAGETYHYAVFAAPADQDWFDDVVEGDNADLGGVPLPEPLDSGDTGPTDTGDSAPPDTGTSPQDSDPDEPPAPEPQDPASGCSGCVAGSGGTPSSGWLLVGLLWRRRRL